MNALSNDILQVLDKQTEPISIHNLIASLPKYDIYEIKREVWALSADGLLRFDWDWKITRSNDGGVDY
jgi:hypothetical protein